MDRAGYVKHKDKIEAWAAGATLEMLITVEGMWMEVENPGFFESEEYRVAVRDFEWARQQLLAGKKVTWGNGICTFVMPRDTWFYNDGKLCFVDRTTGEPHPAHLRDVDLLATDWRIVS